MKYSTIKSFFLHYYQVKKQFCMSNVKDGVNRLIEGIREYNNNTINKECCKCRQSILDGKGVYLYHVMGNTTHLFGANCAKAALEQTRNQYYNKDGKRTMKMGSVTFKGNSILWDYEEAK